MSKSSLQVPAAAAQRARGPLFEAGRERLLQVLPARGHHGGGSP